MTVEEAEVRAILQRLTEAFDHPDYFGSLVMLDDELSRVAAVCESWLAHREALRAVNDNALGWHAGEDGKAHALNVIAVWTAEALAGRVHPSVEAISASRGES